MSKSSTYPAAPAEIGDGSSSNAGTSQESGNQQMDNSSRDAVTPQQMNDLRNAAKYGSVDELYLLISRDEYIFDKIDEKPFCETPLHMAAIEGQTKFAMEILRLKRSFSKKLNKDGYTPMHLALQNTQIEMARCLLHFDEELVRVHGRDGLTPLHHVARTENLDLLVEFLKACPRSVEDETNGGETVLHVALKYGTPEACQILLGWLQRTWIGQASSWEKKWLNTKDEEGKTVLDIAREKEQSEVEKLLLKFGSPFGYSRKSKMLSSSPTNERKVKIGDKQDSNLVGYFKSPVNWEEKIYIFFLRQTAKIPETKRNALLVVAVLLLTLTYQTTVKAPEGNLSGEVSNSTTEVYSSTTEFSNSTTKYSNSTTKYSNSTTKCSNSTTISLEETILITTSVLNCVAFSVSIFSLILLLPPDFKSGMFGLPLYISSLCFLAALFISTPISHFISEDNSSKCILFLILSPILFLVMEGIVLYRRKKLVQALCLST